MCMIAKQNSVLILIILICSSLSQAEALKLSDYKPILHTGQTWLVEVQKESVPPSVAQEQLQNWKPKIVKTYYQFVVEGQQASDKEFFVIQISVVTPAEENPWKWCYRIFVRQQDFTLAKIQRLSIDDLSVEASLDFMTGPVNATDWVGVLPMDFPYFDPNAISYEPKAKMSSDGKIKKKPLNIISQKVKEIEIAVGKEKQKAIEISLNDSSCDTAKHETAQIWIKGMPWWITAVQKRNGREWCTAKLIKVGEKK